MGDKEKCWMKDNCKLKCPDFCIKFFKLNFLYDQALISDFQRKHVNLRIDQDGTDKDKFLMLKDIENNILDFVSNGNNLYIHSSITGNGKSVWSLRLIESYFNKIWYKSSLSCKALFINVPKFLLALKDNISQQNDYVKHIKENVLSADIVVWDEVGVKSLTEFEHENLLNIINSRIDENKSNIYTSNLNKDELREKVGDRLYSRIVNNSIECEFFGKDKRGLK